jgi:2-C-methyl-D-erythritol 2,4-cyclodiphosphate synthase
MFYIENIDATIIAQAPKMRPHIDKMRENIARVLCINIDQVNVKATTEEGLGFTGEGKGISAQAICMLTSPREMATMERRESSAEISYVNNMGCEGCSGCNIKRNK